MKKIAVLILLLFTAVLAVGCSTQDADTVGEVNGIKISKAEYEQRYQLLQASYKMQQAAYTGDATRNRGDRNPGRYIETAAGSGI